MRKITELPHITLPEHLDIKNLASQVFENKVAIQQVGFHHGSQVEHQRPSCEHLREHWQRLQLCV